MIARSLSSRTAFPLSMLLVWFWAAMVVLLLLGVSSTLAPSVHSPRLVDGLLTNPWRSSEAPSLLVKTQILLAIWLWIDYRTLRRADSRQRRAGVVGLLAAGLLLLLLAYGVLLSVSPVDPTPWGLTQIHP